MDPVMQPPVEEHYSRSNLYETILQELQKAGVNMQRITREDLASVDEFHVRGQEVTMELAATAGIQPGLRILDVGCGIGGPCRMLADEYGCMVTGIDITGEFIQTAKKLSKLVGLQDQTKFVHGSALELPFIDESFDIVWTQHAQMNIEDKEHFYSEIKRVLTNNGRFIYYDIFKTDDKPIYYPVPWATDPSISHLISIPQLRKLFNKSGFELVDFKDQTRSAIQFFKNMFEDGEKKKPLKPGVNLLLGKDAPEQFKNVYRNLVDKKIELESGICKKVE